MIKKSELLLYDAIKSTAKVVFDIGCRLEKAFGVDLVLKRKERYDFA